MKKFLIFVLSFCFCLPMAAQMDSSVDDTLAVDSLPFPQLLKLRVDSILQSPMLQTSQLGLMIYDLTADSALYTYGHRQTLRPASTMKLLTAITGIEKLGGDYQLKTTLRYSGTIRNNTLHGNVYCVGGMDPLFERSDMVAFATKLRHLGIDTIRGRILADVSFKDEDRLGEGWCWDDDNPVLSPLLAERKDNFTDQLARELKRDGVVLIDSFIPGSLQKSEYVCSRSHGITELLNPMMKESDNLYAECIFFQLAAAEGQRPAKAKSGANAIKRLIQRVGLAPSNYRIADGSGLSLYNYVSPELMTRLLRYAWRNKNISDCLLPTLPIAGVDGTLKGRMQKTAAYDNVHAKTGTLTGISSLAGYCTAANGHELCFAIINQGVMRNSDGRNFQDQVCTALCK
jgi:D-alanyl-D-alanine carboxypeptidase/D-alanyl-D-alanine-endopeptidase (penicillin-binding protein 4)